VVDLTTDTCERTDKGLSTQKGINLLQREETH